MCGFSAHDFFDKMRRVFPGHSHSFLGVVDFEVHFDGQFWLASSDVGSFCFGVFAFVALDETFGLIDQDGIAGLRFVLGCNG